MYTDAESARLRYKFGEGLPSWRETEDGPEKYQLYLCSREWAVKRNAVFRRCRCVCERCRLHGADYVHHLTYIRRYDERPEDLQAVCRGCHAFIHGKADHDPLFGWEKPKPLAKSLLPDESWGSLEYSRMACPVCGFDYCHPRQPVYHDGQDSGKAPWPGRGDLIVIPVWAECGHAWEICIGSHKGQAFVFTRNHRDSPGGEDDTC